MEDVKVLQLIGKIANTDVNRLAKILPKDSGINALITLTEKLKKAAPKLTSFLGKANFIKKAKGYDEAVATLEQRYQDKSPFENIKTMFSEIGKHIKDQNFNIDDILAKFGAEGKDNPFHGDRKQVEGALLNAFNHPPFWSPKGWNTTIVKQEDLPDWRDRPFAKANLKHISFMIPDIDVQSEALSKLDDIVEAYYNRFANFQTSVAIPTDKFDQYKEAFRALIHNSEHAYALMLDLKRSQNCKNFKIQGSRDYGKIIRPVHKLPDQAPANDAALNTADVLRRVPNVPYWDEDKGLVQNQKANAVDFIDVYSDFKISAIVWSEYISTLKTNCFMSKNAMDYLDYMLSGIFADVEKETASQFVSFYPAVNSLIRYDGSHFVEDIFTSGIVTDFNTNDKIKEYLDALNNAQTSIFNNFPVLRKVMTAIGLTVAVQYPKSGSNGKDSKPDAKDRGNNLFTNESRDPSGTTLNIYRMDEAFYMAAMNSVRFIVGDEWSERAGQAGLTLPPIVQIRGPLGYVLDSGDSYQGVRNWVEYLVQSRSPSGKVGIKDFFTPKLSQKRFYGKPGAFDKLYNQNAAEEFKPTNSAENTGKLFSMLKWGASSPLFMEYISAFDNGVVKLVKPEDYSHAYVDLGHTQASMAVYESFRSREMSVYFIPQDVFNGVDNMNSRSGSIAEPINQAGVLLGGSSWSDNVPSFPGLTSIEKIATLAIITELYDEEYQQITLPDDWSYQLRNIWFYHHTGLMNFNDLGVVATAIVEQYTAN